jgi:pimeloyl-ACP methyl ester carboxylesterase
MWLESRGLTYRVDGPADGLPLVYHHGTPGAALPPPALVEAATVRGLRTVTYARPGYDGSTPRPGRTVADAATDTAAVLDALGAGTFHTLGWSGGGPHALACAALLPDRCLGAASVAGVAPYGATERRPAGLAQVPAHDGLDWTAGMGADNVEEFGAALRGEPDLTRYLEAQVPALAAIEPHDVAAALGDLVSEVDRGLIGSGVAGSLAALFRAGVSTGVAGWRDDDLAFVRDWGFPLAARCPVSIWQGAQDRMVPYAHGRWLAAHWDRARARLLPEQGHLSMPATGFADALDDLLRPGQL